MGREYLAGMIWAKIRLAVQRGMPKHTVKVILEELIRQLDMI